MQVVYSCTEALWAEMSAPQTKASSPSSQAIPLGCESSPSPDPCCPKLNLSAGGVIVTSKALTRWLAWSTMRRLCEGR